MCSPGGGGGGTPGNSWWGCRVQPGSPNPDPILDQKVLLSAPVFRPVLLGGLERKETNSSNPFRIRIFLFLSYSFGIETINTFIHSCSSFI